MPLDASLRLRSTSLLADRRPKPKEPNQRRTWWIRQSATGESSPFASSIGQAANHSVDRSGNAMKAGSIVWRRRARQGYYGSVRLDAPASVPPLTRPPPPGSFAFRFSSQESVAVPPENANPRSFRGAHNSVRSDLPIEKRCDIVVKTLVLRSERRFNEG
jgi:hypothetical protein